MAKTHDRRLLTDAVNQQDPLDLLQHAPIATAISDAVWDTPAKDPLGIVLYGSWGQGKSTVGALVEGQLQKKGGGAKKIAFIRVEAWKYAAAGDPEPLRRHFLLQAYEALELRDEADKLRKRFTEVTTTDDIALTSADIRTVLQGFKRLLKSPRLRQSLWIPVLYFAALSLVFIPGIRHAIGSLVASLLGAVIVVSASLTFLGSLFFKLVSAGLTVRTESTPFRSPEEFDREFQTFLDVHAKDRDRLIFFIDDLDRCPDEVVAEALETLRAFFGRSRCVYIVAADERQLKRAIRIKSQGPAQVGIEGTRIPPDENFLEKVFQVAVHLPPLYYENLSNYAVSVSADTALASLIKKTREETLSYLVHPEVATPRQVKAILNEFLTTYAQAQEREHVEETYLGHDPLSSDPRFIAKMVVLRAHFPWFYELLRSDPQLLATWPLAFDALTELRPLTQDESLVEERVRSSAERAAKEAAAFVEQDRTKQQTPGGQTGTSALLQALRGYLARTSGVIPADAARVQEFIYLRSPAIFGGLTGEVGTQYRRGIANGDLRLIETALGTDATQAVPATRLAIGQMKDGFGIERSRAQDALAFLITRLEPNELAEIGEEAAKALTE